MRLNLPNADRESTQQTILPYHVLPQGERDPPPPLPHKNPTRTTKAVRVPQQIEASKNKTWTPKFRVVIVFFTGHSNRQFKKQKEAGIKNKTKTCNNSRAYDEDEEPEPATDGAADGMPSAAASASQTSETTRLCPQTTCPFPCLRTNSSFRNPRTTPRACRGRGTGNGGGRAFNQDKV